MKARWPIRTIASAALLLSLWPNPISSGTPPESDSITIRAFELHWEGLSVARKRKLLSRLQPYVGRPYSDKLLTDELKFLWNAGPNIGGKVWGEPVAGGVKIVIAVRAISQ
ncbi:MAG: hypothetical protein ABJF10_19240 [Chthoniobacter sp.]|uniref:hypothetical protein n=1 Tax=Chthoniobacter sp. TaxID=2510640 RepID=UPI0032A72599